MSNEINTIIKEVIMEEVASMSVDDFINACERHGIDNAVDESAISMLVEKLFETQLT
tara:strand:- start:206 stop:376 length:171 start_codon:yes stop_codon:yes gene_type:complete